MDHSAKTGLGFGLTSAVITTLGLMIGINSGTHSRTAVIGSVIMIAVADALSDSLGIHISEESQGTYSQETIWRSTVYTFITKFGTGMTFLIPLLLLPLQTAVLVAIVWGLLILGVFSYYTGMQEEMSSWRVVLEHEMIALVVIVSTHLIGTLLPATA